MSEIWNGLLSMLAEVLRFFHDSTTGLFGDFSWGWAIIFLTFTVRLALLPLAVKQTRSMRAMQQLQPEVKKIQAKFKADRGLMKTDPEKYKDRRQKQQEATMALYKEHNVNPAAGCLPLILQMPIFFALFRVLNGGKIAELATAPFYGIERLGVTPAQALGIGAVALIALQAGSTFFSQKQMMANTPASAQQPQQQILLYVMPVMLTFFSFNLPIGVLLYWVATNIWTIGQQFVMFRNIQQPGDAAAKDVAAKPRGGDKPSGGVKADTSPGPAPAPAPAPKVKGPGRKPAGETGDARNAGARNAGERNRSGSRGGSRRLRPKPDPTGERR